MYHITLDDKKISSTNNKIIALINYRMLLKRADLPNNKHWASLYKDDKIIKKETINHRTASISIETDISTNEIFIQSVENMGVSVNQLKLLIKQIDLHITNSKLVGWLSKPSSRKYQPIQLDELYVMLDILTQAQAKIGGYTPQNYRNLITMTGLTEEEFYKLFKIPKTTFYANIADVAKNNHRSMSYKAWLELQEKVLEFLESNA